MITKQEIPLIKRGEAIRAEWLNQIVKELIRQLRPGPGISITEVGGRFVISATKD